MKVLEVNGEPKKTDAATVADLLEELGQFPGFVCNLLRLFPLL
ncbi:MAG: hypothetical protein ACPGYV_13340, partial [Phycisphaeraceae bacterium]